MFSPSLHIGNTKISIGLCCSKKILRDKDTQKEWIDKEMKKKIINQIQTLSHTKIFIKSKVFKRSDKIFSVPIIVSEKKK